MICYILAPIIILLLAIPLMAQQDASTEQLIEAAITRPWPGANFPPLPPLPQTLRDQISDEIQSSFQIRNAYEKLNAALRRNVEWFEAVEELEKNKAVWCLLSCLCHPSEDVQIQALRSLRRLKDKRAVPFLLVYAESMAVSEGGSENATIHGIIQEAIAEALSEITEIRIRIRGQDAEGLKEGILVWREWVKKH